MEKKEYTAETICGSQKLKYILSDPLEKKFLASGLQNCYFYNTQQVTNGGI